MQPSQFRLPEALLQRQLTAGRRSTIFGERRHARAPQERLQRKGVKNCSKPLFALAFPGFSVACRSVKKWRARRMCAGQLVLEREGGRQDLLAMQTDRRAWRAAFASSLIGLALLSALIRMRVADPVLLVAGAKCTASPIGWLGALTAMLVFGSCTLLSKLSAYKSIDPVTRGGLYSTFNSLGSAILNLSVCWLLRQQGFLNGAITVAGLAYGLLGASILITVQTCVFFGCQKVGAACTIAILASTGMCISFFWGVFVFQESLRSISVATLAILVLVLGASLCSVANSSIPLRWGRRGGQGQQELTASKGLVPMTLISGVLFAFAGGLADGTLMVPFKLFSKSSAAASQGTTFQYMEAFGFGQVLCFGMVFLAQLAMWRKNSKSLRGFGEAIRVCSLPGMMSGLAWAIANVGSVHASEFLGVALGFPLTQTNIILHAVVGIVLFGEMPHSSQRRTAAIAVATILLGATLLARAGSI